MTKRLTLLLALLFTNTAYGQSVMTDQDALADTDVSVKPVVTVSSATGIIDVEPTTSSIELVFPAEVSTSTATGSTSTLIITENGAFGTSSTSSNSTTTIETEESTETTPPTDEEKLFDLVFAGFEEFVRITLGWE